MSVRDVDDLTTWVPRPPGSWQVAARPHTDPFGVPGTGLWIGATAVGGAERRLPAPLDLRDADEVRFWLRADLPGDGTGGGGPTLVFEADTEPPAPDGPWRRLLPVDATGAWRPHRLWLGDMPAALRRAVAVLRFGSALTGFTAQVHSLLAVRTEPLADAEAALVAGLVEAVRPAPVVVAVPADRTAPPYLLLTPGRMRITAPPGAEVVDNHTGAGAHVRPAPAMLRLEYALDAVAEDRAGQLALLQRVIDALVRRPYLVVAGMAVTMIPIEAPEQQTLLVALEIPVERGDRVFHPFADPALYVNPEVPA